MCRVSRDSMAYGNVMVLQQTIGNVKAHASCCLCCSPELEHHLYTITCFRVVWYMKLKLNVPACFTSCLTSQMCSENVVLIHGIFESKCLRLWWKTTLSQCYILFSILYKHIHTDVYTVYIYIYEYMYGIYVICHCWSSKCIFMLHYTYDHAPALQYPKLHCLSRPTLLQQKATQRQWLV